MIRWLWERLGSLIIAFALASVVWVAAENDADPIETREIVEGVPIRYVGLREGLEIVGDLPTEGSVTLRAPVSVWNRLQSGGIRLVADLSDLSAGHYSVPLTPVLDEKPARFLSFEPGRVSLSIENTLSRYVDVVVVVSGEPAVGFRVDEPVVSEEQAEIRGPASAVIRVESLRARVDVSGRNQPHDVTVALVPVDIDGNEVEQVEVTPESVRVQVPLMQRVGYRSVAVVPIIEGKPASGYLVANISYSPTVVTLRSADPQAVETLPGFVETEPVSLEGVRETVERRVLLNLPEGFSVIGDPSILLQVSVVPIEGSTTVTPTLEIRSLEPGLVALPSPETVSVILTGPLPTLENLQPEDVRVVLDLIGYGPGTYQVIPEVLLLPTDVAVQIVLPEAIEVVITEQTEPTETPAPS